MVSLSKAGYFVAIQHISNKSNKEILPTQKSLLVFRSADYKRSAATEDISDVDLSRHNACPNRI